MRIRPLIWLSCLLAPCLFPGAARSAGLPSAADILKELKAQKLAVQNTTAHSTWEEVWDGKLTAWEDQQFSWDSLGRRRVIYSFGTFDSKGNRVKPRDAVAEVDTLYDGEVVAVREFYPNRNRLGRVEEPEKDKSKAETPDKDSPMGYRTAILSDAQAPTRRDMEGHRNPMEYLRNIAIRDLESAIAKGRKTTVEAGPGSGIYQVGYEEEINPEIPYVRSLIVVDSGRNYSITKLESFNAKGQTVRRMDYEYRQQDGGLWVPSKGVHRAWSDRSTSAAPVFEWRFVAKKYQVNDPAFDESVFRLALTPDTAVSDTRYGVAYRIGSEKATAADLVRLAEDARAEKQARASDHQETPQDPQWRILWGGITVALVSGLGIYLALARGARA